jgi:hypothetical protein
MAGKSTPLQRAHRLASRQHAAISRRQALGAGLSRDDIDGLLKSRRWSRATRGVYLVTGAPNTWHQRLMVALLAAPAGSVASYLSAAALFDLSKAPEKPQLSVPRTASSRRGHRASLEAADLCTVARIRCTKPARTLVDCAGVVSYDDLCDLVDSALCRKLTTVTRLRKATERVSRAPGRKGIPALERALEVWTWGPKPGSPPEMRLVRLLLEWGFPTPEREIKIYDEDGNFVARVDCGWSIFRVGLEYNSDQYHGPRKWKADDDRENRIEALGWRIEPVDKFDLRPSSTRLRRLLAPLLLESRAG